MAVSPLCEAPARKGVCCEVGSYEDVASLIEQSSRILVLTGSGISASCGIPTYRDSGGLYENVIKEYGLSKPEEVSDINFFRKNPIPLLKHWRAIVPNSASPRSPSPTHHFIAALEARGKLLW